MENLENEIKELEVELNKLKERLKTNLNKRKKPEKNETYFYLDNENDINEVHWDNDYIDIGNFNNYNCFLTRGEVEKAQRIRETENMLRRYVEEHDKEKIDWNDENQEKYYLWFDCRDNQIHTDFSYCIKYPRTIYASRQKILENAVEEIGEDRIEEYLQY